MRDDRESSTSKPEITAHPFLAVGAIVAGVAVLQVANGLLGVLVPLQLGLHRVPTTIVGIVLTAHSVGFLVGCLAVPRIVRRVGHIRAFALSAAATSVVALSFAIAVEPALWTVLMLVKGFCSAGLFTVAESWINDQTPSGTRGRVLSLYMVCSKLTMIGGQLLLTIESAPPLAFYMLAGACYSLSLLPVAATRATSPKIEGLATLGIRELYSIAPMAFVGCFGAGLLNAAVLGLVPVYGVQLGLAVAAVAGLPAAMQFGNLLLQWPLGWLSDRIDRRFIIAASTGATLLVSVAIASLDAPSLLLLYLLCCIWGSFSLTVYAISIAHACDLAEPTQLVSMTGSLLLVWAVGSIGGPLLATLSMELAGPNGLFLYAAVTASALTGFAVWSIARRRSPPALQREPFVNLPATSLSIAELDPRAPRRKNIEG